MIVKLSFQTSSTFLKRLAIFANSKNGFFNYSKCLKKLTINAKGIAQV